MAYSTVQEDGTNLTQRSTINFIGDAVTASDNAGSSRTNVTVAAVRLQTSSPGTAQTGHLNIDTGTARCALQDKGGEVFNVKAFGAVGNGTTDDTAAINSAISAAAALGGQHLAGVVFFPPGTYKTTGGHALSDHLKIRGAGMGATIIDIAHATNDLFSASAQISEVELSGFRVDSLSVVRTGGWAIKSAGRFGNGSLIEHVYIRGQHNGIWLASFAYSWLTEVAMDAFETSGGIALKVGQTASDNQGPGLTIRGLKIDDGDNKNLSFGLWIEDCDGVYVVDAEITGCKENCLKMVAGTYGVHNHFFNEFVSDVTKDGASSYITGTGRASEIQFCNSWFASGGRATGGSTTAPGLKIDVATIGEMDASRGGIEITASRFIENNGQGLYITTPADYVDIDVRGCKFVHNGIGGVAGNTDSIRVDTSGSLRGPSFFGNTCLGAGSGGASLAFGSGTTKYAIGVNVLTSGVTFGSAPSTIRTEHQGVAWKVGSSTQSANLHEFQDSSGAVQSKIDRSGSLLTKESSRVAPWIEPEVLCTTLTTINSATAADITGASVTFTAASDCRVQVVAVYDVVMSATGVFVGELVVSGAARNSQVIFAPTTAAGTRVTTSQVWNFTLTGGTSYTIKLQGRTVGGGSFDVSPTHTKFSLVGLGRF